MRGILIGVGAALLVVGVLYGTWVLGSRKERGTTGEHNDFSYTVKERDGEVYDVLVTCSEEIMGGASNAFSKNLGLQGVPLAVPGGPLFLARLAGVEASEDILPLQRSVIELIKRYSPRRVVIVSHTECLYYDTIGAWKNEPEKVRQHEEDDLRAAQAVLRTWLPETRVRCYMAEREGDQLIFRESKACIEEGR